MSEIYLNRKLLGQFKKQGVMTRTDLVNFFRQYEPELNESAITWRIFDLKRRNIIRDLKRGIYTLLDKQLFVPELDETIVSISKLIERLYDSHFYNIWDTWWLN